MANLPKSLFYALDIQWTLWRWTLCPLHFLKWDSTEQKLDVVQSRKVTRVISTYQTLLVFPVMLLYCYLFLYGLWQPQINTFLNWVVCGLLSLMGTLAISLGFDQFHRRQVLVSIADDKIHLLRLVSRNTKKTVVNRDNKLSTFVCCVVVLLSGVPVLAVFVYNYLFLVSEFRFDPFYLALASVNMQPHNASTTFVYLLFVSVYFLATLTEAARMLSLYFSVSVRELIMDKIIIHSINDISVTSLQASVKLYRVFAALYKRGADYNDSICFSTMGVGYAIFMLSASVSLTGGFYILPLPIFCLFALVMVGCLACFVLALPIMTLVYDVSSHLIEKWKYRNAVSNSIRKEVRAFRPLSYSFGSFKEFSTDAKIEYLQSVSQRTIDACLLIRRRS